MHINQYWKEGKYVDLWSINHILSGVVVGALLFRFGLNFHWAIIVSLALFVGWEIFEIVIGIKEHMTNIVMDVVFDLVGFLLTSYHYLALHRPFSLRTTVVFIVVFLSFNLWGFLAYEKRKHSADVK